MAVSTFVLKYATFVLFCDFALLVSFSIALWLGLIDMILKLDNNGYFEKPTSYYVTIILAIVVYV